MLFHGTTRKGAAGILKEGFKNSERGWYGKGVYMTDFPDIALTWSVWREQSDQSTSYSTVFVNEVLESDKLQTFEIDRSKCGEDVDTPLENQFNKHVHKSSTQAAEDDYKEDRNGRKYRNIAHDRSSALDEYVAEESVTIPRYLILFKTEYKKISA